MKHNALVKKRILQLCDFSAGGCGVFARVKTESTILSNEGHEIAIFSSNREKGTNKILPAFDRIGNVLIKRFPAIKLGGESFMKWDFEKEALRFKPDVIFAHSYRHPHTWKVLSVARKLGCKVYLVTHAPFARGSSRTKIQKSMVWFYDAFIAKNQLNKFDKVITISNWEVPYLKKIGVAKDRLEYIPNGIPDDFFKIKQSVKEENKLLFFGRVSSIKRIESVLKALPFIEDKSLKFEIVGPRENEYYSRLQKIISQLNLQSRVKFTDAIYNTRKKIDKIDSAKFCILPSLSEGMPQSLIEYLARKKLVIASDNPGNADIVQDGQNGVLFKVDDYRDLAGKFNALSNMNAKEKSKMRQFALESVEHFAWSKIARKIGNLIS